jgi:hypothetical protein
MGVAVFGLLSVSGKIARCRCSGRSGCRGQKIAPGRFHGVLLSRRNLLIPNLNSEFFAKLMSAESSTGFSLWV